VIIACLSAGNKFEVFDMVWPFSIFKKKAEIEKSLKGKFKNLIYALKSRPDKVNDLERLFRLYQIEFRNNLDNISDKDSINALIQEAKELIEAAKEKPKKAA